MINTARSGGQQAEVLSIASDTTVKNENGQDRTFGAMVKGTGCLAHTSFNQAAVNKYEAQIVESEFN